MKTFTLLLFLSVITLSGFGQATFQHPVRWDMVSNQSPAVGTVAQAGPDYGCLGSLIQRPAWFYMPVCGYDTGFFPPQFMLEAGYSSTDSAGIIIWGPFDDTLN